MFQTMSISLPTLIIQVYIVYFLTESLATAIKYRKNPEYPQIYDKAEIVSKHRSGLFGMDYFIIVKQPHGTEKYLVSKKVYNSVSVGNNGQIYFQNNRLLSFFPNM